ncbi:hypothetical protein GA0061099_1011153 [Bradyrhizobium yuanmingense]|uniref:DUF6321 domain-containing protein n=1 Tax=Bradyrhizobium yuanmingense TaxID=108015 RepID=A0A1C3XCT4_9BRAD|nr:DUF6321 domain-containing protein [Bradyrhizobium yuanmingense]TWI20448.1 hypothetical protein IQ15_06388 [Bradyrhizobium yuanmingense]SCB49774.1 hypothetical protein GA0061099_1011153 [Bradyrhizobium yuanmingense]
MAKTARTPWKRTNPRKRAGKASKHLSAAQKSAAKARARRAGRRYPNLVDNMRMAAKKKSAKTKSSKKTSKSKASKAKSKTSAKKTRKRTAKKAKSRKRSASAREQDPRGGLTAAGRRAFARKQGHAWGEPVPRTVAEARRIAAKGERLLARYRRVKARG